MHEWDHYASTFYSWRQCSHSWLFGIKLVPAWNLCFSLFNFKSFFLLAKTFSQFFMLTNLTMVFCVLEVGFPIRRHTSISLGSTCTSMSSKTDMTVLSKLLSGTFSGIPLKTTLFRLPYWAKSLWFDSSMATLFSSFSHFSFSLAFNPANFWLLCPSDWWSHLSDC